MEIKTKRLLLRPWQFEDEQALFQLASDEKIGPNAGWPPHQNVQDSREVLKAHLMNEQNFAICLQESGNALIGSIGIMSMKKREYEIGYWIGRPYWGQSYAGEALQEISNYCFKQLGAEKIWCGIFADNQRSINVVNKLGFVYESEKVVTVPSLNKMLTEKFYSLSKEMFEQLLQKA